tara:strand:- start:330 stop:629 length:300 start_codon:yes stop_codon:yes gene_type:complete
MKSNCLSLDEYNKVIIYYQIKKPKNIYKLKKKVNDLILNKMCDGGNNKSSKYNHIINIIRNKRMYSYNKKNLKHGTFKKFLKKTYNRTHYNSPISWLCL